MIEITDEDKECVVPPMPDSHFIAQALAGGAHAGGGYTFTLSSRLGHMLALAERLYGERDHRWTVLGVEFGPRNPHTWFPGFAEGRRDIIIQLSQNAMASEATALWQLAHEVVHVLGQVDDGSPCLVIEEGAAEFFQSYYWDQELKHLKMPNSSEPDAVNEAYRIAYNALLQLLAIDPLAIRKLRHVQLCFSRMTPETFASAGLQVPPELQERLLAPFVRSA